MTGCLRALAGLLCAALLGCSHALPTGQPGPEADALARRIERAVHADAWGRTGAVRFVFRGTTEHLWDRTRGLDRVRFRDADEEILLDIGKRDGRAFRKGRELEGEARRKLVEKAWARFCNDTFWFNPLVKLFDAGVVRSRVVDRDGESLVVHYTTGGVTPGDTYQWLMGPGDLPRAWRMFVRVLKLKGLELTWEGWQPLATGALVATRHKAGAITGVQITDAEGAATLEELEPGPDPFAPLVGR